MARPLFGEILGKGDAGDREHGQREERVRRDFWKVLRRGARNIPFAEDAVAAYFCAFDTNTPFRVRAMLIAALAYFVMPIDAVPDFLAGIGFADDATVLMTALTMLGSHLKPVHREAARRALAGEDAG
ncbi:MAG TPA: YkvA family protein [Kaistia sp.]|nr:YkvA family protein [Kaistia sp.]